jgi:hypothetical protein
VLLIFSLHADQSQHVKPELQIAVELGKALFLSESKTWSQLV